MINCALLKNSSLIRVKTKSLGNSAKVAVTREIAENIIGPMRADQSPDDRGKQIESALARLKATKKLIVCTELDRINSQLAEFKETLLETFCNPSFIDDGLYSVKQSAIPELVRKFAGFSYKLSTVLIPDFQAVYSEQLELGRKIWGAEFDRKSFPEVERLPECFGISYNLVQFDIPEGLPPEIREAEERKLRASYQEAQSCITGALWAEFQKFLGHVTDRLSVKDGEKPKVFRDTLFADLTQFIGAFNNLNTFDDAALGALVNQAKALLKSVGDDGNGSAPERMRKYEILRLQTAEKFTEIKAAVDKGIAELPGRKFDFSE